MLVVCVALSTAFRPFTPVAPPADVLIRSQPVPSGTQLTDGTGKEEYLLGEQAPLGGRNMDMPESRRRYGLRAVQRCGSQAGAQLVARCGRRGGRRVERTGQQRAVDGAASGRRAGEGWRKSPQARRGTAAAFWLGARAPEPAAADPPAATIRPTTNETIENRMNHTRNDFPSNRCLLCPLGDLRLLDLHAGKPTITAGARPSQEPKPRANNVHLRSTGRRKGASFSAGGSLNRSSPQ